MNVQIHECHRNNLCIDCDNKRCWHSGELIADCPMYKCNREGDFFEDCESCELLKQIHAEGRRSGMTDRDKTYLLKELTRTIDESDSTAAFCLCQRWILKDALALLKEQEAVKPIKKDTVEITARYEFDCQCGAPLLIGQPYCANCGRSVKWE